MQKILVVDDEFEIRELLSEALTFKSFEVLTAEDGLQGLKVFDEFKPDLAIVDVRMPNMDGVGFSKRILAAYPEFPIIIISGFLKQYNIEEIRSLGVKEIMTKPLDIEFLYKTIKNLLSL
ncbi:MAG: response regulator [Calditrichaeota bacterium]|nr:response regulator [Calditrichota bacterium]